MRLEIKGVFKRATGFWGAKKFLMMFFAVAVVTVGVSLPIYQAQAFIIEAGIALYGLFGGGVVSNIASTVGGEVAKAAMTGLCSIAVLILNLILEVVAWGVSFAAFFVDIMLDPVLYVGDPSATPPIPGVLDSSAIQIGWTAVRDVCNTFFIFFLLLIAFAMILRVQKFGNTKTLLIKFVMSIFLINFSMVIAKIIIDVGQVFMYEIVTWMPSGFQGKASGLTTIVDAFRNEINFGFHEIDTVIKALFAVIYSTMLMLIYFMLAIFLLIRLVMFAILIVLSPFAFLSLVLPSMSRYTSEWFDTLVKYTLFGPVFLFFIFLSATMANQLMTFNYVSSSGVSIPSSLQNQGFVNMISMMIPHAVALCMLYAVIPVTQRLGGAASQRFIGGTMGLGKIAIGGYAGVKIAGGFGKKVASPVARRTGLTDKYRTAKSRALQKVSENKVAQNVGLGKKASQINATDFAKQRAEVDKNKKWAKQMSSGSMWAAAQSGNKTSAETAAVIEVMLEKKMINKEDAEAHGIKGEKLDDILTRATPAIDADKLKESMPHWAARTELGPNASKEDIDERTVEITTELTSEGKLGSLNKAAKEDATVINTIRAEHDDFDKYVASQSKTDQRAIAVGLEGGLQNIQKELHANGTNINDVSGGATVGTTGKTGNEWRKEIDSIQKSLAKNDKDGHVMLNRPEINAAGEIRIVNGRVDFAGALTPVAGAPEYAMWEGRRKEFAGGMKGESTFKNKSKEFYTEIGQYLATAQLDTLRKAGSTEQMKEAKDSIVINLPAGSPTRDYVENNDYYKDL
ncbi:MAG: hypothetical protein U9N04_01080 [Patescibacteria group bacterium]|nr:hypothetical protein [Patescibacteria group bacterium]